MSGATYLRNLKKGELQDAAQASSLPGYSAYNVNELRSNLDEHLKANATTYSSSTNEHLSGYYQKAGIAPKSPVKKIAEKVSELVKSDTDEAPAPVVKKRRKTTTAPAEDSATALVKTPSASQAASKIREAERRSSTILQQTSEAVAVSPARVVAAFESNVTRPAQVHISNAIEKLHLAEYTDVLRDWASTPLAISVLALASEFNGLRTAILPFKHFADVPLTRGSKQAITVPDLFVLLEHEKFWAPFSLWLTTSVFIPLIAAYFINVPLKAQQSHSYGTRRATAQAATGMQFDPFVYHIAKALITYLVYSQHFQILGLFSNFTIATVNESLYGTLGYTGILTTSAIGAAISLYSAVLKK